MFERDHLWRTWPDQEERRSERHGNALPEEKVARIAKLDEEGLLRVTIAERLCISTNTITKYLRLLGRPIHTKNDPRRKAGQEG